MLYKSTYLLVLPTADLFRISIFLATLYDSLSLLSERLGLSEPWGKGAMTPQIMINKLTLPQPGRSRLCSLHYHSPLRIFRSFYGPELREMQPFLKICNQAPSLFFSIHTYRQLIELKTTNVFFSRLVLTFLHPLSTFKKPIIENRFLPLTLFPKTITVFD